MFIVTSRPISEIFNDAPETIYYAFASDAEEHAKKLAEETNETQTVYFFVQESQFFPLKGEDDDKK